MQQNSVHPQDAAISGVFLLSAQVFRRSQNNGTVPESRLCVLPFAPPSIDIFVATSLAPYSCTTTWEKIANREFKV